MALAMAVLMPAAFLKASAASPQHFNDVAPDAWYYEAVNAMAEAGIVNGYGDGTFKPNKPMTAGEYATVLWNMTYGDICKAGELINFADTGYSLAKWENQTLVLRPDYNGPRYEQYCTPIVMEAAEIRLLPKTWDGAAVLAIYGDNYLVYSDISTGGMHVSAGFWYGTSSHNETQLTKLGRVAGGLYGYYQLDDGATGYERATYDNRSANGLALVAMSKDNITRGFAISELVNVLRETGNLAAIYNASPVKDAFPAGESIADWTTIIDQSHDVCYTNGKTDPMAPYNGQTYRQFHYCNNSWDYINYPGQTWIKGGYANTWLSKDILLAFQCGLVQGKGDGACDVGASMTRAEVCQMLYRAGVISKDFGNNVNTADYSVQMGNGYRNFFFVRDGKLYRFVDRGKNNVVIEGFDGMFDNTKIINRVGSRKVYDRANGVDLRQQEWPTHPEFWTFKNGK